MAKKQDDFLKNKKEIPFPHYIPSSGSFAHVTKMARKTISHDYFYHCRESFHGIGQTARLGNVLFCHAADKGRNVAYFLKAVEKKMGLKVLSKSGPTNLPTVTWFKPSAFWLKNYLRRSLFTILLRSGCQYSWKKDNFTEALFSNRYAKATKPAIEYFIAGNTCPSKTSRAYGWYNQFKRKTLEQVAKMMTTKSK